MKRNDYLLMGILVFIIICSSILIPMLYQDTGEKVEVLIEGNLVKTFSLNETIHYTIETDNGYNNLVIEDGEANIEEASCPDKICIRQKTISKAGESIICLPNKVVVRIVGSQTSLDAVAN